MHLVYATVDCLSDIAKGEGEGFRMPGSETETAPLNNGGDNNHVDAEQDEGGGFREPSETETAPLNGGGDSNHVDAEQGEEEAEGPLDNELIWPPGEKLWLNWVLQLINLLVLYFLRIAGGTLSSTSYNMYVTFYQSPFLSK